MRQVRSWDLFRTLVDARNGNAGEDLVENHYPILENVKRVAPDDIIVSEYEPIRASKARSILCRTGLGNRLIVTADGKTRGTIWGQLRAEGYDIVEHVGDHLRCDVESPEQNGIRGVQVFQHRPTEYEKQLAEAGFPALAACIREARLTTDSPDHRDLELFQIETNFPFLWMAGAALARFAKSFDRLLLSSRDCWLLKGLISRFWGSRFEVIYFWSSRFARYKASPSYRAYVDRLLGGGRALVVDLCGTGNSLRAFFGDRPAVIVVGLEGCSVPSLITGGIDESSNFARHAMVADVVDGNPQFLNPLGIDWENWRELTVMHDGFISALAASFFYDWSRDLAAAPRLDLALAAMYDKSGPLDAKFSTIRRREALATFDMMREIPGVIA
jgi:hypothetical protein